ncbi:hypothetical protein BDP27DRAFT_1429904 [Rhodocollybia butyracea]|uniref:Hydrophobin n=1 Tax=Rhodocollybia butyracea TaxID=206335 RepID=A0A9P5P7Z4_9AGAR|nr:hypothetical protein BDP27DRAFT_1429904 [Rhodocollybia butyracea]
MASKTNNITGLVGFDCSNTTAADHPTCHSQAVCCTESSGGGLIPLVAFLFKFDESEQW